MATRFNDTVTLSNKVLAKCERRLLNIDVSREPSIDVQYIYGRYTPHKRGTGAFGRTGFCSLRYCTHFLN